ncbi:hypothetical protein WPS_07610 [Vulcanimicrobium alpinum]|uniref:Lipoprotein n=1 Tax=Vulcanimicrobium alpinum TaxID=3016050 RepID=A0AAN1XV14_UNVUL|nr:hypothetical protein [Vulcanimicrobium alpinum]BDE05485.1 hypothetical protein WPS_07610 [Vulcanimicrobium alpinum]
MNTIFRLAATAALGALVTACTSNGAAVEPSVTQANLTVNTLQFAVGTANYAGTAALNTVVAYRQPNGNSAVLLDTPTITGPAGFVIPSVASAGVDAGTNHISGSPQATPGTAATPSTFGQSGGAFSYGFAPVNSNNAGAPSYTLYSQPFYTTPQRKFTGGPPLYPNPQDGTYPPNFRGWSQGFTSFAGVPLSIGTYSLSVNVPVVNASGITQTASATLSSAALLPAILAPTVARAGANGATVTFTAAAGTTESIVYIVDSTQGTNFSALTRGSGPQTVTFPDNLGAHGFGIAPTPTFNTGDSLVAYVVGYDYGAYEASPPSNTSAAPSITGLNGQADITVSPSTTFTY